MKKLLALAVVLGLALGLGATALAADKTETATIYFREIKLRVNGESVIPTDAAGKAAEPFILEGTTYLPVRAVAGALGLDVDWDDPSSTVTLTSPDKPVSGTPAKGGEQAFTGLYSRSAALTYRSIRLVIDGQTVTPKDADGRAVEPFILEGTTYLPVRAVAGALGLEVDWDDASSTVSLGKSVRWLTAKRSETITQSGKTSNVTTAYTYDKAGSLVRAKTTADGKESTETYTYENGLLIKYAGPARVITYTYDDKGKLTRELNAADGRTVDTRHTYDAAGRELTRAEHTTDGAGNSTTVTSFEYDARGNLVRSSVTTRAGDKTSAYTELSAYDSSDNRLSLRLVRDGVTTAQWTWTYDKQGNVLTENMETTVAEGVQHSSGTVYTYDDKGNCIQQVTTSGALRDTITRVFDDKGNLLSEVSTGSDGHTSRGDYTYDAGGNLLSYVGAYDNGFMESASYTYDANGNLLTYDAMDSDGSRQHTAYEYIEFKK